MLCSSLHRHQCGGTRCRRCALRPAHVLHHGYLPPYFSHRSYSVSHPPDGRAGLYRSNEAVVVGGASPRTSHPIRRLTRIHRCSTVFSTSTVWFLTKGAFVTPAHRVRDWYRFPELVWLERFGGALRCTRRTVFRAGVGLKLTLPTGTTGPQLLVVGFVVFRRAIPRHLLDQFHCPQVRAPSFRYDGRQSYQRMGGLLNPWGGWHNNHRFPVSARHGLSQWELDPTWWGLKTLSRLGCS